MQSRIYSVLLIGVFLFSGGLYAEEVLLKTGATVQGRILGLNGNQIRIRTADGVKTIPKTNIVRIRYVSFTPAEKQAQQARHIRKVAAYRQRLRQLQTARMAAAELRRQQQAAEAGIIEEKQREARAVADRAAALRNLVDGGQMERPGDEPISFWDFAWRSLLLPGWGHFYLKKPVVGSFYAAGTAGLLGNAYERRRVALRAANRNHRQVETNFLLSIWPEFADRETRIALSYYANAQAYAVFQGQVDDYHNSLYALQGFYLFQLAHIIYNGIAWENGLLIVEGDSTPDDSRPRFQLAFAADRNMSNGRIEPGLHFRIQFAYR